MAFRNKVLKSQLDGYGSQRLWYSEIYQSLSCGTESGILARIAHNAIESDAFRNSSEKCERTLEVGGEMEYTFGLFSQILMNTF